ncbi:tRNA (adenosine(37)-N6)-dimethylallyltransferase MiaA [Spirochaetales bacterium BR193]|uniref:tRNA dimethylallyltransferase n=1 Tax=Entomospira entomophila TaxID=2719988 RepID=A0A968GBT4_9SPIO|nr:tRNA (adenosine(37)-N6)-dimethylallyltransferase MiaA [Entomospira entomophilus]
MGKTSAISTMKDLIDAVIYADASVAYRDLLIGVAKPTLEERCGLPHYMIDILEMHEQLNVAEFVDQSDAIIAQYHEQDGVVMLTGGTLYYLKNFLYGLPQTPAVSEVSRDRVQEMLLTLGKQRLHEQLSSVDPISAERIAWQDSYRVSRALEVYYDSGLPVSSFYLEKHTLRDMYDFLLVELHRPRQELYQRINERVDRMWDEGLVAEVVKLRERGLSPEMAAGRAIGYREFFETDQPLALIKENIKQNTRRYAKRQLTFLRSLPVDYQVHADDSERLSAIVGDFLRERKSNKLQKSCRQ